MQSSPFDFRPPVPQDTANRARAQAEATEAEFAQLGQQRASAEAIATAINLEIDWFLLDGDTGQASAAQARDTDTDQASTAQAHDTEPDQASTAQARATNTDQDSTAQARATETEPEGSSMDKDPLIVSASRRTANMSVEPHWKKLRKELLGVFQIQRGWVVHRSLGVSVGVTCTASEMSMCKGPSNVRVPLSDEDMLWLSFRCMGSS